MTFIQAETQTGPVVLPADKCWFRRTGNSVELYVVGAIGGPLSIKLGSLKILKTEEELGHALQKVTGP